MAMSASAYKAREYSVQSVASLKLYLTLDAFAVLIATRAVSIFSDGLVVALTWVKTYRVFVLTRQVSFRTNYSALILRDGEPPYDVTMRLC